MHVPGAELADRIAAGIDPAGPRPFVLGIAGAQGSGKSTAARLLGARFGCPVLSLDDFYLGRAERAALAARVHPLLRTRGVPGTHDWRRGIDVLDELAQGRETLLPRFDKACDEPGPPEPWRGTTGMVILEGWCLGSRPQREAELATPVNALERERDPDGAWRRWVNARVADYQPLFARIDKLVFLAAPGFEMVARWRCEQEAALRQTLGPHAGMTEGELAIFIEHFQRITEHMLRHAGEWADTTIRLDAERRPQTG